LLLLLLVVVSAAGIRLDGGAMSEARGSNSPLDELVVVVDGGGPLLEVMLKDGAEGMMGGGLLAGSSDGLFSCHDDDHDSDDDHDDSDNSDDRILSFTIDNAGHEYSSPHYMQYTGHHSTCSTQVTRRSYISGEFPSSGGFIVYCLHALSQVIRSIMSIRIHELEQTLSAPTHQSTHPT
jgi:hypothetical protein